MVVYIFSIDSSLSMGLGLSGKLLTTEDSQTRYRVAVDVLKEVVARVISQDPIPHIALYRHGHKVERVCERVTKLEDVVNAYLSSYETVGSSHHGSLIELVDQEEEPRPTDKLVIFTDASSFDGDMNFFTPCETRFVIMNTEQSSMDAMQMEEIEEIAAQSIGLELQDKSLGFGHQFMYDGDTPRLAEEVVEELFIVPEYSITVGNLQTRVQLLPPTADALGDVIEIYGFVKLTALINIPVESYHYIKDIGQTGEDEEMEDEDETENPETRNSKLFLQVLYEGLLAEGNAAVARFKASETPRCGLVMAQLCEEERRCLLLCLMATPLELPPFVPAFDRLVLASHPDAGGEELETKPRNITTQPSYSSSYISWHNESAINNDLQKIIRLMKKIPERIGPFYAEVNKIRRHAQVVGSPQMAKALADVLQEEAKGLTPAQLTHISHICKLLPAGFEDARLRVDIAPP